jgi:3D (Asp-Asp-Asp) domain-containing protein
MHTEKITMVALCLALTLAMLLWFLSERARMAHKCPPPASASAIDAELADFHTNTARDEPLMMSLGKLTVTIYHAVPAQTDSSPMITASNKDLTGLDLEAEHICALSRDLLERWGGPIGYGDQVYINIPDPELRGWWTVEDTMAARWTNHIDLLVPTSRERGKWFSVDAWTILP